VKYAMAMKVAHFIATLDIGGAEKQLLTLCREQVAHGYEVALYPLKGANSLKEEFESIGVRVSDKLRNRRTAIQYLAALFSLRELKGSVIHGHSAKAQLLLTLLPISLKNRLIYTKHDAMQFVVRAPRPISRFLWLWVQARSSRVLVISDAIRAEMNARHEDLDWKKAQTSYYGISRHEINEIKNTNRNESRKSLGIKQDTLVIGAIGRFVKEKNQLFLIEVFEQYLKTNANSILIILGYGPLESELKMLVAKKGIQEKVKILDRSHSPKDLYTSFDLFILPSITEGFGLVLLEAMAAELPIIASNVGAIPEVMGMENKFLFDPGNQLELLSLFVDSTMLEVRKKQALELNKRLSTFTSEAMFNRINSVYNSL
jgi:glycosyltransferase involved in cell wall biosynthesis